MPGVLSSGARTRRHHPRVAQTHPSLLAGVNELPALNANAI